MDSERFCILTFPKVIEKLSHCAIESFTLWYLHFLPTKSGPGN